MCLKQWKIKVKPRMKLNHNIYQKCDSCSQERIKGTEKASPIHTLPLVIRLELFLESGYGYLARCVDVSWRFRVTKRRAKHVGRTAKKA